MNGVTTPDGAQFLIYVAQRIRIFLDQDENVISLGLY